ncbi:hypothetical protein [Rubrivirga sp.]|uniref:hypothetical protein n=1 Tax=Rubrivirga sp. TaxID=1885344 RepID=UPI003C75D46F
MTTSPQHVRTQGAARPRNLAIGCLAVLIVIAALWMVGRVLRSAETGPAVEPEPVDPSLISHVDA